MLTDWAGWACIITQWPAESSASENRELLR